MHEYRSYKFDFTRFKILSNNQSFDINFYFLFSYIKLRRKISPRTKQAYISFKSYFFKNLKNLNKRNNFLLHFFFKFLFPMTKGFEKK